LNAETRTQKDREERQIRGIDQEPGECNAQQAIVGSKCFGKDPISARNLSA